MPGLVLLLDAALGPRAELHCCCDGGPNTLQFEPETWGSSDQVLTCLRYSAVEGVVSTFGFDFFLGLRLLLQSALD